MYIHYTVLHVLVLGLYGPTSIRHSLRLTGLRPPASSAATAGAASGCLPTTYSNFKITEEKIKAQKSWDKKLKLKNLGTLAL
jgi:hypothetical protein